MRRVICCLWAGDDLPSYSANKYTEYDVARLRRLIRKHLPGEHTFNVMTDAVWFSKLSALQSTLYETTQGFFEHDLNSKEEELSPPYTASKSSVLNELSDVELWRFTGTDCGGWSKVLEAFGLPPDKDRTLLIGLDTVPINDISWLFDWDESPVGLPWDPLFTDVACDAVVTFNNEGAQQVTQRYSKERLNGMKDYLMGIRPSEMMLLRAMFKENKWSALEPFPPKKLLSYKAHVKPVCGPFLGVGPIPLDEASIVYFHGTPKPGELPLEDPIGQIWRNG